MSDSTDNDIVKRRRVPRSTTKKDNLKNLFDEDSSTSSLEYVPEDTQQNNLFQELFGTGEEYFYIFESHKQEEEEKIKQEEISEEQLLDHMKKKTDYKDIETICKLYLQGYNIYYIFLYKTEDIDFYKFLDIYKNMLSFTTKSSDKIHLDIFNIFFDRIYNGSLCINKKDKIISLTKENFVIKGVILDGYGNLIEKFSCSGYKLISRVEEINPQYILVSGNNNIVRNVVQLLIKFRVFYMESKFYPKHSVYEKLIHVGRLGLFPEVEFINFYKNLYITSGESYNNLIYKEEIFNNDVVLTIKIAIGLVISVTKMNLDFLLQYENKLDILRFLGLENCTRIFENESYTSEEDIYKVLKDEVIYQNFMTFFTLEKKLYDRPVFTGFTDSYIFRELINIKNNIVEDLINQEIEGKVFFVDEFYVLVNILNNVTCYVRTTEKYYLNQLVRVKITEINEPFLSFTAEIVHTNKPIHKIIKHPLLCRLNSKEAEKKLINSDEIFILRQSSKDGKIIIVLKLYKNIIIHIRLEEYDNLDETVNKRVKNILRNVSNIKKHKYFYDNASEAMSKISMNCDFIRYGFYFSEEYPGRLCFIFNNNGIFKEYLSVDTKIKYKEKEYNSLEEFLEYRKRL